MTRRYSNTAVTTTLSSGVTAVATTVPVTSTTGFPAVPFILALDADASTQELVLVTGVSSLNLTATRGYDNTTAVSHDAGAVVRHSHAAIDFRESRDHEAATAAHGVTSVVGTTEAQALTNKDLSSATNTLPVDLVRTTGAQTLTNKTLTDPTVVIGGENAFDGWDTWTPTVFGVTLGNGTVLGYYKRVGKTVHYAIWLQLGSTSSVTSTISFDFPVPPKLMGGIYAISVGAGYAKDASTTAHRPLAAFASGAGSVIAPASNEGLLTTGGTSPWTWAQNDSISLSGTYEAV